MPVYIGDVLESSGGPVLNISTNQIAGIGVFESIDVRDNLDSDLRVTGYISIIDGNLSVYNGTSWVNDLHWEKLASDFSLYGQIPVADGAGNTAPERASYFVESVGSSPSRFSFGVFDSDLNDFRKISGEDLRSIIIHYFGQEIAFYLSDITANDIDYYTDPGTGVAGDVNGDGLVTVSDILIMLGMFGNGTVSSRDYRIEMGQDYWTGPSSVPLIGTFAPFSFGGYQTVSFVDGFTNNTNVTGTTGGDDVSFINTTSQKAFGIERNDNEGVPENIWGYITSGNSTPPNGNTIFFSSDGDVSAVLDSDMNMPTGSAPLRIRVRIVAQDGSFILKANGSNFTDVVIGQFNNGGPIFAGNNYLSGGAIDNVNFLQVINDNWNLNTVSFIKQIQFAPYVYSSNSFSNYASSFEIQDLVANVIEG
jgi:hypothetical protein